MRKALIALVFLSMIAHPGVAQQHPNQKKGFNANDVYQFNGLDTINAFNGNLTLSIPIGSSYSVGGGLSYGLTLFSNAILWEGEAHCHEVTPGICTLVCPRFNKDCDPGERVDPTFMYPHRRANAGVGWTLSFGRLYQPEHPTMPNQLLWTYESPDGADHVFQEGSGLTVSKTIDGSYLRMTYLADDPYTTEVGDPVRLVEFTDGTIQVFQPPSATATDYWGLRRITNGFPANYLTISYGALTNGQRWTLQDSHGRTHWIDFQRIPYDGEMRLLVKQVHLSRYGTDTPATIEFNYLEDQPLSRGEFQTDTFHHPPPPGQTEVQWQVARVPLLSSVVLPDGLSYTFSYRVTASGMDYVGVPFSMTVPTGGMIEWEYGPYYKPAGSAASSEEYYRLSYGVTKRKLWGKLSPTGTRDLEGTWDYEPSLDYQPNMACDPYPSIPIPPGYCNEFKNTITGPLAGAQASKTVHYFSVAMTNLIPPWNQFDYGLPFTKNVSDGSSQPRWLSTKVLGANDQLLRSTYVRYDSLPNPPRPESSRVVYNDDSGHYMDSDSSDWDNFGHHRTVRTSGTFPNTPVRVSTTNYLPANGAILPGDRWIRGLYDSVTVEENGKTARTDFCFDTNTGFLKQKRTRKDAANVGANDLLAVFEPDARGNVRWERYYGGDILPVSTNSICGAVTGTFGYEIGLTRVEPTATTDGSAVSKYTGVDVNMSDVTIDRRTGLVSKSRDTAGVETTFEYDWAGRLLWEKPTGRAWTKYEFITPTSNEIKVFKFGANLVTPLLQRRYRIDALGRVDRETTTLPGNVETERNTVYNALGRRISVSEPGQPTALTSFSYDALGRVASVTLPDSSITTTAYVGDRQKTRTSGIRTSTSATDVAVPVVEKYDGFGRLVSVTEKSGPTTAAAPIGALVTTEYEYDLADRLISVTMNRSTAGPVQHRLFDYDGRGFLRWESQPESGMTSYTYDARGNALSKTQGAANTQFDLKFFYDFAGRLTRVDGRNPLYPQYVGEPEFRVMKEFAYGAANATLDAGTSTQRYDLRKGKLTTASRYNYLNAATHKISDRYEYTDTAGRKTGKVTTFFDGQLNARDVSVFTAYDDLDLPVTLQYPMCEGCGFPPQAVNRGSETRTYDHGRLKSVSGFLGDITYWPNGMRKLLPHLNGVTDQQEVGAMARPTQIKFGKYDRCVQPTFVLQPGGGTRPLNTPPITLTVNATGTEPVLYEWYGSDSSDQIPNPGDPKSIEVSPTVTTEYQAFATNECGQTYSQIAKVTVTGCEFPSTGTITAVTQPDGSWVLTPHPTAQQPRSYQWKRLSDNANLGIAETQAVGALSQTTTFSLTISDGCGSSTSNVTIVVPRSMSTTGLVATANASSTQVTVTWPAVTGATSYSVERRSGGDWAPIATPTSNSFVDTQVIGSTTYAYRAATGNSNYSNVDVATTMAFPPPTTGEPITTGTAHQMLTAVNKVRAAAGWPAVTWATILSPSDPVVAVNNVITSRQLLACRARLNEARQALGAAGVGYTDADVMQSGIKALHIREVLEAVQ